MRLKRLLTAAVILVFAWCGLGIVPAFAAEYDMPYYIEVDLTNQLITVFNTKDSSVAYQMLCSAGERNSTPTGTWYLPPKTLEDERTEWYLMKSYNCWVKYATKIDGPYFFHSIPYRSKKNDQMNPNAAAKFGNPASHGCIRLRVEDARFVAENCLEGTRVHIYKSGAKNEDLRTLLLVSSFNQDEGISYSEFLGIQPGSLGKGSAGGEVEELQLRLRDLGYYDGSIDGNYETATITAVKNVQKDLGIAQSGTVSAELKEVIFSSDAPVSAGQVTLEEGSSGPAVKQFQNALISLGVYDGEADSVYDTDVVEAVKELQRLCGYTADGVATPEIQHLAYYEVQRIEKALGSDYTVEHVTEEIKMGRMIYKKAKIIVRAKPNTNSNEMTKVGYGDEVLVLAVQDEWAQVVANGKKGFMYKKYLEGFTTENYVLRFTGNGESVTIGNTLEEYINGGYVSEQEAFRDYYVNAQYLEYMNEPVGYVTVSTGSEGVRLNMRSEPSSDSKILAEVPNGTNLRVLATEDGWTRVGYDNQIGYLMNEYLSFWEGTVTDVEDTTDALGEVSDDQPIKAVVIADNKNAKVNVYQEADGSSSVLGGISVGEQVRVITIDEDTGWVLILYDSHSGYMRDESLSFEQIV